MEVLQEARGVGVEVEDPQGHQAGPHGSGHVMRPDYSVVLATIGVLASLVAIVWIVNEVAP